MSLFFTKKSYDKRREIQKDIVFLGIDPKVLLEPDTIFSNGNAAVTGTNFYNSTNMLDKLDWNIITDPYWKNFNDGKRIKCAEALVYKKIDIKSILKIFCHSKEQCSIAYEMLPGNISIPVEVNKNLYFEQFL